MAYSSVDLHAGNLSQIEWEVLRDLPSVPFILF